MAICYVLGREVSVSTVSALFGHHGENLVLPCNVTIHPAGKNCHSISLFHHCTQTLT